MGFIETHRADYTVSVLINPNLLLAARDVDLVPAHWLPAGAVAAASGKP